MFEAKYEPLFVEERTLKEIAGFWEYFQAEEDRIIAAIRTHDRDYMRAFEARLDRIFFRKKKPLRFCIEKKDEVIHFVLFYGHSSYLLTVGDTMAENMPGKLAQRWSVDLQK